MQKFFIMLLCVGGFALSCRSQAIDTIQTIDYGKMPPVHVSNKVYWERNYDNQHHLLFEGLKYNSCFIGVFISYWPNGTVKTRGQYVSNKSKDWTNLKQRGLCSVPDGAWKGYNEDGKLNHTVIYKKGMIEKEY